MLHTERFAPSPTGRLHLGHAFSAILAHDRARAAGGRFLLRLEDLDRGRVRPEYEAGILEDLAWLGLTLDGPVLKQSERIAAYEAALARLTGMGLIYACRCTRRDVEAAIAAPNEGEPVFGPDGAVYPGTCRKLDLAHDLPGTALRLDMSAAAARLNGPITYHETAAPHEGWISATPDELLTGTGDVVLRRRDGAFAYHLAVVVDDAFQGVTHVTRGADLASATPLHRLLQELLGLPRPEYHHHRLIRDDTGKRLAKRHDALALAELRAQGATPESIRARLFAD